MAYSSIPSAAVQSPSRGVRATAALFLLVVSGLLLIGALLELNVPERETLTNKQLLETRYSKELEKHARDLADFEDFSKQWRANATLIQKSGIHLADAEKTDQNQ